MIARFYAWLLPIGPIYLTPRMGLAELWALGAGVTLTTELRPQSLSATGLAGILRDLEDSEWTGNPNRQR